MQPRLITTIYIYITTVYLSIINVGRGWWRWRWKVGAAAAAVLLLVPLAVLDDETLLRDVRVHQLGHAKLLLHLPEITNFSLNFVCSNHDRSIYTVLTCSASPA